MLELKYFAKIDAYKEQETEAARKPQALPPFDLNDLGADNLLKRGSRAFLRWFFLFAFWVLRAVWPVARIGRMVIVTRYADVCEVLNDPKHFPVPFGPEMEAITDGESFALGLDGKPHEEQRDIVDEVLGWKDPERRRKDGQKILDDTRHITQTLLDESGGRIDAMRDLLGRVFTETCSSYFGLDLDEPNAFLDRSMAVSALLFADPFGSEVTRKLALNGAVRMRYLIDRAIDRAVERKRTEPAADSLVDRLVRYTPPCGRGDLPSRDRIRAIVIGILTGFVPTNTLAAGKMVEELLRRGLLQSAIGAASAAETARKNGAAADARRHRQALQDILFEVFRLNPALSPGQFRFAPKAATIAGKPVPGGCLVVAATMSALRDGRKQRDGSQLEYPGEYRPGRKIANPALMFGAGSHVCPGFHLAREQITEIFQILFSRPGLRIADGPTGWLQYLGPFPRRLDFMFRPATSPSIQNLVTIQGPIAAGKLETAKKLIEDLGNPAEPPIRKALDRTGVVHFVSLSAFDASDPDDKEAKPDPRLVFELNIDGDVQTAFRAIAREAGPQLKPIFQLLDRSGNAPLVKLFNRHRIDLHFVPWGAIGLNFNGTPDCPVDDVRRQRDVATFARQAVDLYLRVPGRMHKRAMDALTYVRDLVQHDGPSPHAASLVRSDAADSEARARRQDAETGLRQQAKDLKLRDFLIRPTRRRLKMSEWTGYDAKVGWQGVPGALKSNAGLFIGLLMATTLCLQGSAIHLVVDDHPSLLALWLALAGATFAAVLVVSTVVKGGFDTLVRWWKTGMKNLANGTAFLLAALSLVPFIVLLLARRLFWPAALTAGFVLGWCALTEWLPGIPLAGRIALATLGSVAATLAVVGVWSWLVDALSRVWRSLALLLAAAVAAFWVLQQWTPELFPFSPILTVTLVGVAVAFVVPRVWRSLVLVLALAVAAVWALQHWAPELVPIGRMVAAALVGIAVAYVVPSGWTTIKPKLRRYRQAFEWAVALIALAAPVFAFYEYSDQALWAVGELGTLSLALGGGILATFLIWLVPILVFVGILYWHEIRDVPDDQTADLDDIRKIAAKENARGYAQNHITAVTLMKPGSFRKLTLALVLWAIGKEIKYWFRPGFVLNMGTIHYARWFRLPGSEMMVFLSNYDGSWQSYLEDFITKAHEGQSAVWSHGRGFPKTKLLVFGGAADGDRFKRWVRRQQIVTPFWYSRFPELTTDQIRTNALIHDGLMRAHTDTAARAWLDCIGTMPRPQNAIETDEVQSLVFRGLARHDIMLCAALTLPGDHGQREEWLRHVRDDTVFGEQPDIADKPATFVAFSAQGIAKCLHGKDEDKAKAMAAFPSAFRLGMADREKVLGDAGESAPKAWAWADIDRPWADIDRSHRDAVDAMLFIYGRSPQECQGVLASHEQKLRSKAQWTLMTQPTAKTMAARHRRAAAAGDADSEAGKELPMYEHFGFRDGISQPILGGTQRAAATENKADVVEPGELILGYRDSFGYIAPAVTLSAESDPGDDLETDTPDFPSRFPRFAGSQEADLRDFGRNGTFVVIRQLAQNVDDFNTYLGEQKTALGLYPGLADSVGGPITEEWVAAKMMGRWRSGASLVSRPHEIAGRRPPDKPDNDFSFAADDPQGLRCPFGAHIRRANPRGSLAPNDPAQAKIEKRHRLLRRGRPYVDNNSEKGLLFVGLCADIERQFEFLQQTWVGSPNFHGLNHEPDPITVSDGQGHMFTIPTPTGPVTMKGLRSFVTVRAGGYFFMPSRSALRYLAGYNVDASGRRLS